VIFSVEKMQRPTLVNCLTDAAAAHCAPFVSVRATILR